VLAARDRELVTARWSQPHSKSRKRNRPPLSAGGAGFDGMLALAYV